MKICFYADHHTYGGLANNGGSQTILRSAEILRGFGHRVDVVSRVDRFTWFDHKKPVRRIPKDVDVCIAVSVSDIKPMLTRMPKRAKAFWWCRLLETYQMPKSKIIKYASKVNVLVNSEGLYQWFGRQGVKTKVAYQGVDIDEWRDYKERNGITIGFLVSNKKRKHFEVVKGIIEKLGDSYVYVGYGSKKDLDRATRRFTKDWFTYFATDISHSKMCDVYNLAHIWVATSTKEGLHNPPIEAALCGASVVYPDAPLAGCSDHCVDGETAWRYQALDIEDACRAIREANPGRNAKHIELIKEKIGSREVAMGRFVRCLQ